MRSGVCVLCGKMGALALHSALDARLETKKKKNLPDAGGTVHVRFALSFFSLFAVSCQ